MIDDLVRPTTEIARVIDAVADGDLSQKMELKIEGRAMRGEFRRIGTTVNAMVDQLSSLRDEVRASRAKWAPTAASAARPR
jgi:Signal transduction histidine kinase involved in nitrogen fixation and metabolism regulation